MRVEVNHRLGCGRYQRSDGRQGYRNGSYARDLLTSYGWLEGLVVPRVREGGFQPYVVGVRPRAPTPSETRRTGTSAVHGTFSYNLYTNPDMIREYPAPLSFPDLNPVYSRLSYSVFQPVG